MALYSNGQYEEAIVQIKSLNELFPNVPLLFNLIGACYKELGQLEGSVQMFKNAININDDYAEAHLGKNPKGQMSVTRIDLHPVVRFDTGFNVEDEKLAEMQDRAHRYCFIANTLADSVEINIR